MLHEVVREPFETWLALKRDGELDQPGVLGVMEHDLRQYLTWGVLADSFGHAQ